MKHQNLLDPRQLSAANRRPHGGDGKKIHRPRNHTPTPIPDTDATRLLQRYGVRSPAALRDHSAAPLAVIEHARRRQLELDAGPGMIVQILDDNGLVWKSCGKRVDNRAPMPPDDPELEKYRSSLSIPPWMREGGDT